MNDESRQGASWLGKIRESGFGHGRIIIGLVILASVVRLSFSQIYTPRYFPDSRDYFAQAQAIAKNVFGANVEIGKGNFPWPRPQVYPFIIACAGLNWSRVFFLQACMGIAITVLLYLIFARMSGSKLVGFFAGAGYALNPSQLLIEFGAMSQTTGTFLLMLALFFFFRIIKKGSNPGWLDYLLSGVLIGIGMYCRSQFQVILGFMLLFLLWRRAGRLRKHLVGVGLFILPVLGMTYLSGDLSSNFFETGVQPIHGITMSYNVVHLLEYAPDEYARERDILIKYREDYRRSGGATLENCVAVALNELLAEPGMNIGKLSDKLGRMTLAIARRAPLQYAKKIFQNLANFWRPAWFSHQYGIGAVLKGERLSSKIIAVIYTVFHLICMLIFILLPLTLFFKSRLKTLLLYKGEVVFIYSIVLSTNLLGAVIQYGDPSYKISFEPLIIGISLWVIISFTGWLDRSDEGTEKFSAAS